MQSLVSKLIGIIHEEVRSLHKLLELVDEEQETLVQNDAEKLVDNVARQETLLGEAENLEKRRLQVTEQLSRKCMVAPGELTMSRLTDLVEEAHSAELKTLQHNLLDAHQKIEETNRNNELLIRQSMGYITRTLDVLTACPPQETTYERSGRVQEVQHRQAKMVDRRI